MLRVGSCGTIGATCGVMWYYRCYVWGHVGLYVLRVGSCGTIGATCMLGKKSRTWMCKLCKFNFINSRDVELVYGCRRFVALASLLKVVKLVTRSKNVLCNTFYT